MKTEANTYTDSTMIFASELAYLDFDGQDISVGDAIDQIISKYGKKDERGNLVFNPNFSSDNASKNQFDVAMILLNMGENLPGLDNWREWVVVDVCNDQDNSGYYGMMIDTKKNNPIIVNRGSEGMGGDYDGQFWKDWIATDLGLVDSTLVKQQEKAENYMEELWYKYGGKYSMFSVTGHSLGGNLAQHMTVHAPAAMRNKIERCLSLDGPGFSNEYLNDSRNKEHFKKKTCQMDHYQWSFVSSLLTPLSISEVTTIMAHDDVSSTGICAMITRHNMSNIDLDENGNAVKGDESLLAKPANYVSRIIDGYGEKNFLDFWTTRNSKFPRVIAVVYEHVMLLKFLRDTCAKAEGIYNKINFRIKDMYYNYIKSQVSGNYSIRTKEIANDREAMIGIYRSLHAMIEDVKRIRNSINFESCTSAYYRSQILIQEVELEYIIKNLDKLIHFTDEAASQYVKTDIQVGEKFLISKSRY